MEIVAASTRCAEAPGALSDFQFALPAELIAQVPAAERDGARLLVLDRRSGTLEHTSVLALPEYLRRGDLLVVNDTRVIPARVYGHTGSGAAVELLLIGPTPLDDAVPDPGTPRDPHACRWQCLGKPARHLRAGTQLRFASDRCATVTAVPGNGRYTVEFDGTADVLEWLQRDGEVPLPPYIRRPDGPLPLDHSRYQTIFAAAPGSIAAPTAGLHYTAALVRALQERGVRVARLTLHVGPATFLPIRCADVRQHVMEPEWCEIPAATAAAIRAAKAGGGRVVAVGTTTTRALESAACAAQVVRSGARWAEAFIVPGQDFRVVDALFTNFHLPGSTLLLLVSAFAGQTHIHSAYAEAIRHRYRFYSYGDAMLIQ